MVKSCCKTWNDIKKAPDQFTIASACFDDGRHGSRREVGMNRKDIRNRVTEVCPQPLQLLHPIALYSPGTEILAPPERSAWMRQQGFQNTVADTEHNQTSALSFHGLISPLLQSVNRYPSKA